MPHTTSPLPLREGARGRGCRRVWQFGAFAPIAPSPHPSPARGEGVVFAPSPRSFPAWGEGVVSGSPARAPAHSRGSAEVSDR